MEELDYTLTIYTNNLDSIVNHYYRYTDSEIIFEGKELVIIKYKNRFIKFEHWPEDIEDIEEEKKNVWSNVKDQIALLLKQEGSDVD